MTRIIPTALAVLTTLSAACGSKRVDEATPTQEWECQGRRTSGSFRLVVRASSRDEAMAEVRKQYPDAGSSTNCVPNPSGR
jgi:hypothetical protein